MKNLDLFDAIVATNDQFERKGKTMIFCSANGYMFALLNKAGEIGFRLPKEKQKEWQELHGATEYKSYGAVMRDYIKVPEDLLDNMQLLAKTIEESYQFVMSLPPK